MEPICIQKFKEYFEKIGQLEIDFLDDVYSENVEFQDPLHRFNGLAEVKGYFTKLNSNLGMGQFHFMEVDVLDGKAYLRWVMDVRLKKPKSRIRLEGMSVLYFEERITQQKDFFDLGAMIYENIPLLGRFIRAIKKKIAK